MTQSDVFQSQKISQSREEAASLVEEALSKPYKEAFKKLNKAYVIHYENLCNTYLRQLARKICGRAITNNAKVLKVVSSYKNNKHAELFRSLIPQIRNSVQHQDFVIDVKKPVITFYDRKKPPLSITLQEYSNIFWE